MTIHFPDLSHHKQVSLDGALALITKATQGTSFVDPSYATYKADANKRGIPFCAFHWVDTTDLGLQAAHAYRVIGSTPCMWDAEAAGSTVPRLAELTRRYRAMGGNPRLVYLPQWFWRDHLGSPSLKPLVDEGLALVSSRYTTYSDTGPGWAPYGGMSPAIWQYTDAHPFNGALVDFNAFKGTVDDLRVLWGLTPEDDMAALTDDQLKDLYRRVCNIDSILYYGNTQGFEEIPAGQMHMGFGGGTPTTSPTVYALMKLLHDVEHGGGVGLSAVEVRAIVREELDKTKLSG